MRVQEQKNLNANAKNGFISNIIFEATFTINYKKKKAECVTVLIFRPQQVQAGLSPLIQNYLDCYFPVRPRCLYPVKNK